MKLKPKETAARLSLLARQAAVFSAKNQGFPEPRFLKNEENAPIPENGVYWAISHKPTCVAGVVATSPVGIDIEKVKPMGRKMFEQIASDTEWALFGERAEISFFRMWTAKEAVLKSIGIGYRGIENCYVREVVDSHRLTMAYENDVWQVSHFYMDDHIVAMSTKESMDICWKIYF